MPATFLPGADPMVLLSTQHSALGSQLFFIQHSALSTILLVGACLGHTAIAVWSHNWWYAAFIPRSIERAIRLLHYVGIVAGVVALWLVFEPGLTAAENGDTLLPTPGLSLALGGRVSPFSADLWQAALAG